jgi:UDP-N-acetylmuramoyl-tripeptide--D-alanyl-D-alanine ligase
MPKPQAVTLRQAFSALSRAQLLGCGDEVVASVSTDTRRIRAGSLFIAIKGETFDAHHFVPEAKRSGAAAVMVERWVPGLKPPALVVTDTRKAYGEIARAWRLKFSLPLISVAGSNGKTTTKEMIAAILRAHFGESAYLSTRGNLNNDIGVPQTLLALRPRHLAGVVELGTNHPGEIGELAAYACASVAVVTNAQREHQEFLHGVEASALENGASFSALSSDGIAVFPGDDACASIWRRQIGARRSLEFGLAEHAGIFPVWARLDASSDQFNLMLDQTTLRVRLNIAGRHNVRNALAAAASAHAIGLPSEAIVAGLEAFRPASGRLESHQLSDGRLLIDDTYNANPDSVRAAVDVLMSLPEPRVLVLGDMGEVGEHGDLYHREVGEYAAQQGINRLYCLGLATRASVVVFNAARQDSLNAVASDTATATSTAGQYAEHYEKIEELLEKVQSVRGSLLVKGSRFMRMERVIAGLGIKRESAQGAH